MARSNLYLSNISVAFDTFDSPYYLKFFSVLISALALFISLIGFSSSACLLNPEVT